MSEPTDLWVGPPPWRRAHWNHDPETCGHTDRSVCPSCTHLDAYEAEAIRRFLAGELRP
jgi:hypothetical protein